MPPAAVPTVSPLEMAVWEANALALGVSVDTLMENAGRAVAEEVAKRLENPSTPVGIVAGTGNNGGDGSCAAFYLSQWGHPVELWLLGAPTEIRSASARRCFDRIQPTMPTHLGVPSAAELPKGIIVDAMLGTGQTGALRSPYRESAEAIRRHGAHVLSIDVPTGLRADGGLRPQWTVALSAPKEGMTAENSGEIVVREIGIPQEARTRTGPGEFLLYPPRGEHDSRGRRHRVLVIGGGPYAGAPALAALAALRAGAERATVAVPSGSAEAVAGFSPDLVVRPIGAGAFGPGDVPALLHLVDELHAAAVLVGMGAGGAPGTLEALERLLTELRGRVPLLVDADALRALPPRPDEPAAVVATPNAGEYARVFRGDPAAGSATEEVARKAREWGVTLLVKGGVDTISDGRRAYENHHHHAAATVGGVGDVLAGVVGGLLAQGLPPVDAARLGTYWVGLAGLRAAESGGYGILASDVLAQVPATLVEGLRRLRGPA